MYQIVDRLLMKPLDLLMGLTLMLSHIEWIGNSPDRNLSLSPILSNGASKIFSDLKTIS